MQLVEDKYDIPPQDSLKTPVSEFNPLKCVHLVGELMKRKKTGNAFGGPHNALLEGLTSNGVHKCGAA